MILIQQKIQENKSIPSLPSKVYFPLYSPPSPSSSFHRFSNPLSLSLSDLIFYRSSYTLIIIFIHDAWLGRIQCCGWVHGNPSPKLILSSFVCCYFGLVLLILVELWSNLQLDFGLSFSEKSYYVDFFLFLCGFYRWIETLPLFVYLIAYSIICLLYASFYSSCNSDRVHDFGHFIFFFD